MRAENHVGCHVTQLKFLSRHLFRILIRPYRHNFVKIAHTTFYENQVIGCQMLHSERRKEGQVMRK
jgi:hypothetical protein